MTRSLVVDPNRVKLETMRADISWQGFDTGLVHALCEYDLLRKHNDYYWADARFSNASDRAALGLSKHAARLADGMSKMTSRGILMITARTFDDQPYIKSHMGYFTDLVGLFYFDAGTLGELTIATILRRAWAKGRYPHV